MLVETLLAKAETLSSPPASLGLLYAWGGGTNGELGNEITAYLPGFVDQSSWTAVSVAQYRAAAIRSDGMLFVWGQGNLGDGVATGIRSSPVQIGSSSWTAVSVGINHILGIRYDGMLFGWGLNTSGQLGDDTLINKSSPVQIGSSSWTAVSAGRNFSGAIRSGGTLFTWGSNTSGQLGDGTVIAKSSPVQIGSSSWTVVSLSQTTHSAAIRSGGTLFTWGNNSFGQLGDNTVISKSSPVQIGSSSWTAVSAGGSNDGNRSHFTGAIRSGGTLFTWGNNSYGQLGDGTFIAKSSPVQIGSSSWIAVSASSMDNRSVFAAGILSNNKLLTWGASVNGQLGRQVTFSSPVQLGSSSWIAIDSSITGGPIQPAHTLAIRSNYILFAWGIGDNGRLGDNSINRRDSPVQIGSSSWIAVAAGNGHSAAIRYDGKLFTWGNNNTGQLGDGTVIAKSSPVQIGSSSWIAVSAGSGFTSAIRSDGRLFTWGNNNTGQLGDNTVIAKSSPVQIGSSSWTAIDSNGGNFALAIRSDGILFAFGYNGWDLVPQGGGRLGDGTFISRSSPVQIGSSSWTAVSAGGFSAAIRSDGALFTWGYNSASGAGRLGNNAVGSTSSPIQIGSSSWIAVAAGNAHGAAIRSDGILFAWGYNSGRDGGRLGDNTTIDRSSPVQIGSSSWTAIAAGNQTFGLRKKI